MSQKASRGSGYGRETGIIDLGHEPPLSVDGSEAAVIDRRRVSVQWFSGTILTGLCGAALIGGAVFASLDGEMTFAKVPERVEGALRGAFGANDRTASLHKSDRLPPPGESTAARNVVRVSTVDPGRQPRRDAGAAVRPDLRQFVDDDERSQRQDPAVQRPAHADRCRHRDPGRRRRSEQSRCRRARRRGFLRHQGPGDGAAEGEARRRGRARRSPDAGARRLELARHSSGVRYTTLANAAADASGAQSDIKLAYATEGNVSDPYAGFETRVVPENVTLLPKTKDQITGGNPTGERVHVVKKGDTVTSILRDQGATPDEAKAIASTLGARGRDGGLKEGQKLRILMAPSAPRPRRPPAALPRDRRQRFHHRSRGRAVRSRQIRRRRRAEHEYRHRDRRGKDDDDDEDDGSGVRLYQSIYETALRNKVPATVIEDMVRIYSYDVDFQRKVQPGDSFDVFFAGEDEGATITEKTEVLFASLTVGGETKKYYRFQTPDDAVVDYYDETGKSAKKFLVRKPVNNAIMRSGFGGRRHPILGYIKMHTGVDWATPYGTPIFASGNGVVEKVGWEGGYGKYVRLKHNNGYETAYGHMSAFAKGMEPGKRVRQGQVIGFVGSTGMSTGAHVHYEILVNGRFVDPMRVKLPRGRSLEGALLAGFEKERDRLDAQMNNRGSAARVSDAAHTPRNVRQVSNR